MARGSKRCLPSASNARKHARSTAQSDINSASGTEEENPQGSASVVSQDTFSDLNDPIAKFNAWWKVGEQTDEQILGKSLNLDAYTHHINMHFGSVEAQ